MSKGGVWNKGKHNGGASREDRYKVVAKPIETVSDEDSEETLKDPINNVQRMDRKDWVVRPTRVVPPKKD
jgi:hypothetical protein